MLPFEELPLSRKPENVGSKVRQRSILGNPPKGLSAVLQAPDRVLFLDIETTGLSWHYDQITMVGWAMDGRYEALWAGQDPSPLHEALEAASAVVTFNGTQFDLKFLRRQLPDLRWPSAHLDLRYPARRVGLVGGQKAIESHLGFERQGIDEGTDGAEAVRLWYRYQRGDATAAKMLATYNKWDVAGMCLILDEIVERLQLDPDLLFRPHRFSTRIGEIVRSRLDSPPLEAPRRVTFDTLFPNAGDLTIVGIDLTGSEARPSGWCRLATREATTRRLSTDDELIALTLASRPDLVSIDSPLSLPTGRQRVDDDDPTRAEFGIMRECERELKRRGINVYPSLIPSMQKLTQRGIELAARIRAHGVPVIESYPGAAQDIMRIPRKGASIELLRQGLADFGITGPFEESSVSHDELDAITSALVGVFYLTGQYEALTGQSEGALIIPDIVHNAPGRHARRH